MGKRIRKINSLEYLRGTRQVKMRYDEKDNERMVCDSFIVGWKGGRNV